MLNETIGDVIIQAAEIIEGKYRTSSSLMCSSGACTPFNMNMNEVIANIAILKLVVNRGNTQKSIRITM